MDNRHGWNLTDALLYALVFAGLIVACAVL